MKKYFYETSCVECQGRVEALDKMIDEAAEVSYSTLLRNCQGLMKWAACKGYVRNVNHGLTLKNDWAVNYYRGTFEGHPCYFLQWSGIEFIWVKQVEVHKSKIVRTGLIERGSPHKGYRWVQGYSFKSENVLEYPWMTYQEIQKEAKKRDQE